ncbi:MAG: DUF4130 domain-containing protein [Bacteroidaceae bacterium]|nr:DUF4130 domain-containing protein [Bacteroidaceae bacterium]
MFGSKEVEYLDYTSEIGRKVYMRSFTFVLYKAVEDLLPGVRLVIEAPVSKGYFFTLRFTETNEEYPVSLEIVQRLKTRIKERLNPRKQLNDMPRRYWKYLTEKQV